ncbi:MAG TPA: 5-formyltetrahydrofolate cyclo-ligase [Candidatus Dormibacteraeota bacterium]|nr:5-formyltetrahydrofolate cyclo-ligase [Candidatus Dormibacteraeota bacterium]
MKSTKSELRQALKKARLEMLPEYHQHASAAIVKRLKELIDWSAVETVHYFEPIRELLEVDISPLVTFLEDNYPRVQLFAPRLIGGVWQMVSIKDKSAPTSFDVIIVPMLGFDKELNRIGYGGGYYDKFLAAQPRAKKVGTCFETGKTAQIPTEPHDIALDVIVTEEAVYTK